MRDNDTFPIKYFDDLNAYVNDLEDEIHKIIHSEDDKYDKMFILNYTMNSIYTLKKIIGESFSFDEAKKAIHMIRFNKLSSDLVKELIENMNEINMSLFNSIESSSSEKYKQIYEPLILSNMRISINKKYVKIILKKMIDSFVEYKTMNINYHLTIQDVANKFDNINNIDDIFDGDYPIDKSLLINEKESVFSVLTELGKMIVIDSVDGFDEMIYNENNRNNGHVNVNKDIIIIACKRYNSTECLRSIIFT
jgi:hypothetical protein